MTNKKRYFLLDVYKIICTIFIVFHHYQQFFGVEFNGVNFYGGKFYFGYVVELFFMISGFVLLKSDCWSYNQEENRIGVVSKQFCKRIIRFYPLALIAFAFSVFLALVYYALFREWISNIFTNPITYVTSATLTFSGFPFLDRIGINNPAWYLCVLIQCYFSYYLIKLLPKKEIKPILYGLIVIFFLFLKILYLPGFMGNSHRGYIAFFVGVLLSSIDEKIKIQKWYPFIPLTIGIILCVLFKKWYWYPLTLFIYPSLLLFACSWFQLSSRTIKTICLVSFSVYLFHSPLEMMLSLFLKLLNVEITHSYLTMILFFAFVSLFACLVHFLIERNINKLINKGLIKR